MQVDGGVSTAAGQNRKAVYGYVYDSAAVDNGGRRVCQAVWTSYACPIRSTVASSKGLPTICKARGSPAWVNPHGTVKAG